MPFLMRQGPSVYAVLVAGLAGAAAAVALLELSGGVAGLILARALQGLAAAAITGSCSSILATASAGRESTSGLVWLNPAFLQSLAMTTAPVLAGLLHDYYDVHAVLYCAYAVIAVNLVLCLVVVNLAPASRVGSSGCADALLGSGAEPSGYGTMSSGAGSSGNSSRSVSPTTRLPEAASPHGAPSALPVVAWSPRLLVSVCSYSVVCLLTSALQSVLPLFVKRHFNWSVLTTGYMFIPLSAPAVLIGPLAGILAARVPKSIRFLATAGFLAYLPAFMHLAQLRGNTQAVQHAFLLTLSGLSLATGLSGVPLVNEITSVLGASTTESWSATAQAAVLPSLASASGSLVGPLFAGAVNWLWEWQAMNQLLAAIAAATSVASLLFLQGWIGSPLADGSGHHINARADEEASPLLASDHPGTITDGSAAYHGGSKRVCHKPQQPPQGSDDDVSPHTRATAGPDRKPRTHRRHFSVDNFSVATTATAGSMDSSTSSVRFQAALETPVPGDNGVSKRRSSTMTTDTTTTTTTTGGKAERRYVMREAPHAPATDPLLAAGSLYVIDEERDNAARGDGVESRRQKRRAVVFPEGAAPPELLARHRHHVVAINALDGTARMVADGAGDHAVCVTEEVEEAVSGGGGGGGFGEGQARRYVVVVVEEGEEGEVA